jgi:hypothetical protein
LLLFFSTIGYILQRIGEDMGYFSRNGNTCLVDRAHGS